MGVGFQPSEVGQEAGPAVAGNEIERAGLVVEWDERLPVEVGLKVERAE